jgi:phage/plasmid primase-like uncharacterized protein
LENNPGRVKALEAAQAAHGMVVFPNFTAEQREKGLTDFNDLALENPALAKHQLEQALGRPRERSEKQVGEIGKGREVHVPKDALEWVMEKSMELAR